MPFGILENIVGNVPVAALVAITAGFIRAFAGWVENAWKDGKVEAFEWKQLGGTIVKYFSGVMLLMLGLPVGESDDMRIFF